jgi:hypothetical protein
VLREGLTALVVALPFGLGVAAGPADDESRPVFRFQDPAIVESSGLAIVGGLVVTVNDSGDSARVFTVDPATGRTVGTTRWPGEPEDVEALAPAGRDTVWVGDIGDNAAGRDTITVTRVPVGPGDRQVPGAAYRLRYPDGPRDAEALLAVPSSDRLVVVTKGIFGGEVFAAPESLDPEGVNRLRPLGSVMPLVTGGEFFPDGRHLVLRDYSRAVVYTWPALESVGEIDLPKQEQGEAVVVTGDGSLLVSSEGQRAPVHEVAVPADIEAAMAGPTPTPSAAPGSAATPTPVSREGKELPEDDPGTRDPTQWLIGTGLLVVALLVLLRALRPTQRHPPR